MNGGARVLDVRFENQREAFGIGESRPRLSWKVGSDTPGWMQSAYELELRDPANGALDTTGRVPSGHSSHVAWPWSDLGSRDRRAVRVRVWGSNHVPPSEWSPAIAVETGLLHAEDWIASLIGPDRPDVEGAPPPLFRQQFDVAGEMTSARLYVTSHGLYEVEINGQRVGDHVLAPGWTSYQDRLRYQTFDVGPLIRPGPNVIGATVADGWYTGRIGFRGGRRRTYGDRVGIVAQLEIRYPDGTLTTHVTDQRWKESSGPIRAAGLYAGETYDARLELSGWSEPGFDDTAWTPVRLGQYDPNCLVAPSGPPVRRIETRRAVAIDRTEDGAIMLDFGQNLVGRLRLRVRGPAGQTLTVQHAEVLEDGRLCTRMLRHAAATDRYTLRGERDETWEPRFTIHGFRYAEIKGWPGEIRPGDVEAVVIHTDLERTGHFECSDPEINRLHENVVWSLRGNFVDIPTDCPQRDERLGWTGDLQLFAATAAFLFDCSGMLSSWLADLAAEQRRIGTVPPYVPWVPLTFDAVPIAAWGDAAVIVPWVLYQRFGDSAFLERQFSSMAEWVDQIASIAGPSHRWQTGLQFGDWLDPAAPSDRPAAARTDPYLVATAYHAWTAGIVAQAARVLGRNRDGARFEAIADRVRAAFREEFVSPTGRIVGDTQTGYALALQFGLLDSETSRTRARTRLLDLVRADDHHIGTGFVGTPLVCDALTDGDAIDDAYLMLTQQSCPSWLYPVTMGATTIWERWDSLLPDGRINPGQMTSFNHYALGAIADWLHRVVAGLAPLDPGYRRILAAPRPGGGLRYAQATHETPLGPASIRWERRGRVLTVDVSVPPGASAVVNLPAADREPTTVGAGQHTFECAFRAPADDPPRPAVASFHVHDLGDSDD